MTAFSSPARAAKLSRQSKHASIPPNAPPHRRIRLDCLNPDDYIEVSVYLEQASPCSFGFE
jgi:hypothetical protein